jgi:hypothetical protein
MLLACFDSERFTLFELRNALYWWYEHPERQGPQQMSLVY